MGATTALSRIDDRKILALILAGGNGSRLKGLTANRAKPAVPFGGHNRIVDYAMSNCVRSGIPNIAVLTQYRGESLIRHLQENWFVPGASGSSSIEIWPAQHREAGRGYAGTADAVYQNRELIGRIDPDEVLIAAGDQVYEMDYAVLASAHARAGADVTISCVEVPIDECRDYGIVNVDEAMRLASFVEKPQSADGLTAVRGHVLASMGVYLFSVDYLFHCLDADARDRDSDHDFGRSVMPRIVGDANVNIAVFRSRSGKPGYWRDVGTIDNYWRAHQELLDAASAPTSGAACTVLGAPTAGGPAQLTATAAVRQSAIGTQCWIAGSVEKSVVSTGCTVDRGSSIRESVLLPKVSVGRGCTLNRVIVDSGCRIQDNTVLDARYLGTGSAYHVSPCGVVLVTEESLRCLMMQQDERQSA